MPTKRQPPRVRVESILNKNAVYLLVASIVVSVGITLPRFGPGIPMSIDTTSHLYRILFLQRWLREGIFPFWSPDWYGGSPALLLYPPLGYYLVLGLAMLGIDPLLSYKIVDAISYWLAPIAIYFLGKELGFSRGESALGGILFSVIPEVIENYLFFDRFPTVISIPIFCAFVIMFHRSLMSPWRLLNVLGSILTMSALLLTHHLSALIAGIVAVLMVLLAIGKAGFRKPFLTLVAVGTGTFALTAFWLVPFILSVDLFSANQFYNPNVEFPFLRFQYFGFEVTSYLLGIAQLILAALAIQSILGRTFAKQIPMDAIAFFPVLLGGMMLYQAGELADLRALTAVGRLIIIVSLIAFFAQFVVLRRARKVLTRKNGVVLTVLWFILFLWIGLGYFADPLLLLPYLRQFWTKTMDVYRIWLYLALPMSVLAARGLLRSLAKLWTRKPLAPMLLIALVIVPITLGVALKVNYSFNHAVNDVLPYSTANVDIPPPVIGYFRNDLSPGRILGINVPLWIYVLPNYVDKPIVDGWYPQTKLVTSLVNITDYRLDDLETRPNSSVRINTWKALISNSEQLDITWVIIGERKLANVLMKNADFTEQIVIPYRTYNQTLDLVIFKAVKLPSFVESDAPDGYVKSVARPNPDEIILSLSPATRSSRIVVKEAYFPTWAATADGQSLAVNKESSSGYIQITAPPGARQIVLHQKRGSNVWNIVSVTSFAVCIGLALALLLKQRRTKR